VSLKINFL